MGVLQRIGGSRRFTLGARCLIGRHARCDLRADEPRVSSEHASVHWIDDRWEIRDLGSRNGTFVDGRRLSAGEREELAEGATFTLGGAEPGFSLIDAAPPSVAARNGTSGLLRAASDRLLVLPDDERPELSIFEDDQGHWVAEREEGTLRVADHEVVLVDGEAWVLELPIASIETWQGERRGPALETIAMRFGVSRDEEYVEATVLDDAGETKLPARSHHYLLATLARARLADADALGAERGWVDREALCKMLATDLNKLNVDIFRARKQLAAHGVHGAAGIVARRPGTGQIRIGIDRVEVVSL